MISHVSDLAVCMAVNSGHCNLHDRNVVAEQKAADYSLKSQRRHDKRMPCR